jgi:peptidoglycan-N-acetylglucosamine deacetylase
MTGLLMAARPRLPALGFASIGVAGFMAWAVRGRSSQVFGPSVWHGNRARRGLALTFDDGPSEDTPRLLELLDQHRVRATFFQIGANVERLPAVAWAVRQAGHVIGNHSYSHRLLCSPHIGFPPAGAIERDLRRAQQAIAAYTGVIPAWFRAPYGVRWFGLRRALRRLDLSAVMWTVIGYDWNETESGGRRAVDRVVARIVGGVSRGAILCLHDGRELRPRPDIGVTLEAVRRLVPLLLDQGYEFETLEDLLCPPKN